MKIIFTVLLLSGFALSASAQSRQLSLANSIKINSFKPDTTFGKLLEQPKTLLATGNLLVLQSPAQLANDAAFNNMMASQQYSSRMPVKHLQSTDNMPVAPLNSNDKNMPVIYLKNNKPDIR